MARAQALLALLYLASTCSGAAQHVESSADKLGETSGYDATQDTPVTDAPTPAPAPGSCRHDDDAITGFQLPDEIKGNIMQEVTPVSGGFTDIGVSNKGPLVSKWSWTGSRPQSWGTWGSSDTEDDGSPAFQPGKMESTSATDFWARGFTRPPSVVFSDGTYGLSYSLVHFNSVTKKFTDVQGIEVRGMLDFVVRKVQDQILACFVNSTTLSCYGIDLANLTATPGEFFSKDISLFTTSEYKLSPQCCESTYRVWLGRKTRISGDCGADFEVGPPMICKGVNRETELRNMWGSSSKGGLYNFSPGPSCLPYDGDCNSEPFGLCNDPQSWKKYDGKKLPAEWCRMRGVDTYLNWGPTGVWGDEDKTTMEWDTPPTATVQDNQWPETSGCATLAINSKYMAVQSVELRVYPLGDDGEPLLDQMFHLDPGPVWNEALKGCTGLYRQGEQHCIRCGQVALTQLANNQDTAFSIFNQNEIVMINLIDHTVTTLASFQTPDPVNSGGIWTGGSAGYFPSRFSGLAVKEILQGSADDVQMRLFFVGEDRAVTRSAGFVSRTLLGFDVDPAAASVIQIDAPQKLIDSSQIVVVGRYTSSNRLTHSPWLQSAAVDVRLTWRDQDLLSGPILSGKSIDAGSDACSFWARDDSNAAQPIPPQCWVMRAWNPNRVLPCHAVNPILSSLSWTKPSDHPGTYWYTDKLPISVKAGTGSQPWNLQLSKTEQEIDCPDGSSTCRMVKLVACSQEGAASDDAPKQCCTQRGLRPVSDSSAGGAPVGKTMSLKLGELRFTDQSPDWQWPTASGPNDLSELVPRLAGVDRVVAGSPLPSPLTRTYTDPLGVGNRVLDNSEALEALHEKFQGCVTDGDPDDVYFGTSNPDAVLGLQSTVSVQHSYPYPSNADAFRSNGISASTSPEGAVDAWVVDLPFCMLEGGGKVNGYPLNSGAQPLATYLWSGECMDVCGDSGNTSRILHVNALTGKTTSMKSSTDSIFLDVAAAEKEDGDVHLVTLHLERTEADAAYMDGVYSAVEGGTTNPSSGSRNRIKILRPAGCPDQANCGTSGCSKECAEALRSLRKPKYPECGETADTPDNAAFLDRCSETTTSQADCDKWGGSLESFMKQKGLQGWPQDGNFSAPLCVEHDCSCCFRTCPTYILSFHTATKDGATGTFNLDTGSTANLEASCVIPSIAADKHRVFVMTSSGVTVFNHAGQNLTTWQSPKLEYQPWWSTFTAYSSQSQYKTGAGSHSPMKTAWLPPGNCGNGQQEGSRVGVGNWLESTMGGRMGGQITLASGSADSGEVYFTTVQGHIFRGELQGTTMTVTELLQSEVHMFQGAAVQTYQVPGIAGLQKRLYVTSWVGLKPPLNYETGMGGTAKPHNIERINLNALEKMVEDGGRAVYLGAKGYIQERGLAQQDGDDTPITAMYKKAEWGTTAAKTAWGNIAKQVTPPKHMAFGRTTRLAYAEGKLYYMASPEVEQRSKLYFSDVTVLVNCEDAFALADESFRNWDVSEDKYGTALYGGNKEYSLHETSKYADPMPWQFSTYKKVVQITVEGAPLLVAKEVICSKPLGTRPSKEKCCVRKRTMPDPSTDPPASNTCSLKELLEQM